VAHRDRDRGFELQLRGHERGRRGGVERGQRGHLIGQVGGPPVVLGEHLGATVTPVQHEPTQHRGHRMPAEGERRDDTEVAAAAADRPEQLRMLILVGDHRGPVGGDQLDLHQVVAAVPVPAGQPPDATAEGQTADPGRGDHPAGGGQPMYSGRGVQRRPGAPTTGADRPRRRVHHHRGHVGQVDHHPGVADPQPGDVVATATDRDGQVMLPGQPDRRGHVIRGGGADDQRRISVDHAVPHRPAGRVARVLGSDDPADEPRRERRQIGFG